ncbi:MAG: putative quinol monooxygenase [Chloroflexota bacterium]
MIVIHGKAPINPEKRELAKDIMKTMMDATLQEEGCITYQFLFNPWDDAQVQIFEEWETQDALDKHFHTEHMATFRQALPQVVTGNFTLKRYVVSEVTVL